MPGRAHRSSLGRARIRRPACAIPPGRWPQAPPANMQHEQTMQQGAIWGPNSNTLNAVRAKHKTCAHACVFYAVLRSCAVGFGTCLAHHILPSNPPFAGTQVTKLPLLSWGRAMVLGVRAQCEPKGRNRVRHYPLAVVASRRGGKCTRAAGFAQMRCSVARGRTGLSRGRAPRRLAAGHDVEGELLVRGGRLGGGLAEHVAQLVAPDAQPADARVCA